MHDWFAWYVQRVEKQQGWAKYRERARAIYEVCGICDWEDDGQDSDDAAVVRGGPNGSYSLCETRENFTRYFTMYRPTDTHAFQFDQMDRPLKEQLFRNFSITILSESDEHWQRALAIEHELTAQREHQDRTT